MAARGNRAIRRDHGRTLDGKTRGAALTEQNGTARTAGSGLGQGEEVRERERGAEVRGRDRGHGSGGASTRA